MHPLVPRCGWVVGPRWLASWAYHPAAAPTSGPRWLGARPSLAGWSGWLAARAGGGVPTNSGRPGVVPTNFGRCPLTLWLRHVVLIVVHPPVPIDAPIDAFFVINTL